MAGASTAAVQQQVAALMSRGADVELKTADGSITMQSSILCIASDYFMEFVESLREGITYETNTQGLKVIPAPGTTKSQWMKVVPFLYPLNPSPVPDWDSVEAMLEIGDKFDMPKVHEMAVSFFRQHAAELCKEPSSPQHVWKWLLVLDGVARLQELCVVCCDQVKALYAGQPVDATAARYFAQVSKVTLQQLLTKCYFGDATTGQPRASRRGPQPDVFDLVFRPAVDFNLRQQQRQQQHEQRPQEPQAAHYE